jgi:maltose alpha-D-glucosyltransferase / alpha-amylase
VNVEAEMENSSSLLHWTRRMIQVRRHHPCFGMGTFTDLGGSNPSVLSYVRQFGDDVVLCVNNLSRFPQPIELDLRRWEGVEPIEMLGGVHFPQVGELPYLLTLGNHGFYWFRLPVNRDDRPEPPRREDRRANRRAERREESPS